jgi:5-methylcytosine-specific restriction endonuclease McrA
MSRKDNLHLTEARDVLAGHNTKRSSHWPAVEHKHLKDHPTCEACGGNIHLQVHHRKPFHLFPELELEPTNLITLCMEQPKDCHIKLGHGGNFKAYNPNVDTDVAAVKAHFSLTLLEEYAIKAKNVRLLA